jgi:glycine betaine/choline ABC-type transport system substrate-binding protein
MPATLRRLRHRRAYREATGPFRPHGDGSALNVRESVFQKYPQLEPLFKQVSSKLTQDAILQMNTDVDVKGQQAKDVAKNWATKEGLLG